ncbi:tape measure protein [Hoeflea alexandrii]|uniref:Tape measure protein N-terminal domain-containing protein n=1 Tax=Hoeflea alexandrii TaxID=288436 RepID=A0ABT1CMC7_9HYPH|nr:tape measure protein [Hoeflea alexandrii]MCO6407366.1 hypothetical protein [Hoeflea alexandrii]
MVVDELIAILGYEVKGEEKLRRFSQSIDRAAANLVRFAAVAGTAAATAMGVLGRSVINTSAEFEGYAATLETIEGSSEKAQASLDWISEFAKKTPFEVSELTEAFVRLRAYGMDPTQGLMESLGDASSGMGKSLMQAVEMIADASTGEFERIKEFGIKARQEGDNVTFSWSQNGEELSKTVKKTGTEITKFIQDQFGARFGGAMMRQSKTWNGMMSNLSDGWVDFQRRIGEAGFFDAVKNQLAGLMDAVARLDADDTLDRWAKSLSDVLTSSVEVISNFATRMARHFDTISGLINTNSEAWNVLKAVLLGVAIWLFPISALFVALGLAIDDFLTYLRGGESVIGDAIAWLGELKNAILAWLEALPGNIGDAFADAWRVAFDRAKGVFDEFVAWANAKLSAINPLNWLPDIGGDTSGADAEGNIPLRPGQSSTSSRAAGPNADGNISLRPGQSSADINQMLSNAQANIAKTGNDNAATAVTNTVNDSSDKSVTVNVGGVNVQQATQAPAAVGQAVGNAAAGAARAGLPPARISGGGGF